MILLNLKNNIFLCRVWITVIFAVGAEVKVKGKIVIQAGTPVIASIQASQEEWMAGWSGKISFSIQLVETVDEQNIPILGQFVYEGKSEVGSTEASKKAGYKDIHTLRNQACKRRREFADEELKSYTVSLLK